MKSLMRVGTAIAVAGLVGSVTVAALAASPAPGVPTYTGCLSTGSGAITQVALGSEPLKPCSNGSRTVHLSSGDITGVTAGTGLVGGADEGDATLGLLPAYQLPQGCTTAQVAKPTGTGTWGCATDALTSGTTYAADGQTLSLSSGTFSIAALYQLPQDCAAGEIVARTSGGWACSTDKDSDTTYAVDCGLANSFLYALTASGGASCKGINQLSITQGLLAPGAVSTDKLTSNVQSSRSASTAVDGTSTFSSSGSGPLPLEAGHKAVSMADATLSCTSCSTSDRTTVSYRILASTGTDPASAAPASARRSVVLVGNDPTPVSAHGLLVPTATGPYTFWLVVQADAGTISVSDSDVTAFDLGR